MPAQHGFEDRGPRQGGPQKIMGTFGNASGAVKKNEGPG